jgi:hypothetical protein
MRVRVLVKLVLVLLALFAGLLAYDCLAMIIWDGSFPLEVRIAGQGQREIVRISTDTLMQRSGPRICGPIRLGWN